MKLSGKRRRNNGVKTVEEGEKARPSWEKGDSGEWEADKKGKILVPLEISNGKG